MGLKWFGDVGSVLPFGAMVTETLALATNFVVMKAAFSQGMNKYVLSLYSNCLSTLIFFFCSIIFNRSKSSRPPLSFGLFCVFVLSSILGFAGQICMFSGIQYSSATLGSAVLNLIPAFTFILAIIFRMEKLEWRRSSSQAKVVGTIVSIAGAFVVTLYKGPPMMKMTTPSLTSSSRQLPSNWVLGGFFFVAQAFIMSAICIIDVVLLRKYPAVCLMMFYRFSSSTVVSSIYCVIMVGEWRAWRLRLDVGLVAILYSGFTTAVCVSLIMWCLPKTGPLYVSMFKPLGIIFTAVLSIAFLGDVLCIGSVIGAAMIVIGFYMVMWGKAREKEMNKGVESSEPSANTVPFLRSRTEQI